MELARDIIAVCMLGIAIYFGCLGLIKAGEEKSIPVCEQAPIKGH